MQLSPGQSRLIGAALSGMVFAGSMFGYAALGMAATQTTIIQQAAKQAGLVVAQDCGVHKPNLETLMIGTVKPKTESTAPVGTKVAVATNTSQKSAEAAKTTQAKTQAAPKTQTASAAPKEISRGSGDGSTIVDTALSMVGTRYVSGGMSKSGFDCSGLAKYSYARAGISIPRDSYSQFASGTSVSKSNLQPGDLVFFSTYAKGASHVGIYIGGGRFVHASNPTGGVKNTSMSDSYYAPRYLGARRY